MAEIAGDAWRPAQLLSAAAIVGELISNSATALAALQLQR